MSDEPLSVEELDRLAAYYRDDPCILRLIAQARKALAKPAWPSPEEYAVWLGRRIIENGEPSAADIYDWLTQHAAPAKEKIK